MYALLTGNGRLRTPGGWLIDPYDTKGIARTLRTALAMPLSERRERHEKLLAIVCANDLHKWHTQLLARLVGRGPVPAAMDGAECEPPIALTSQQHSGPLLE